MKATAINLKTGDSCINPLENIKTFLIEATSLDLYIMLNVKAEQGTLGIHKDFPVAFMPIALLFRNIKECKIYPSYDDSYRLAYSVGKTSRYETMKIMHYKIIDDCMLITYLETKRVGYPHMLTLEEAERIKPFKWNLGTLLTIEKTEL